MASKNFSWNSSLGLLQLRRVAGPEPLVDLQQGALVVGRRVLLERLEDQRVLGVLQDARSSPRSASARTCAEVLEIVGAALDQDLAGLRVDDVAAGDPAFELGGGLGVAGRRSSSVS